MNVKDIRIKIKGRDLLSFMLRGLVVPFVAVYAIIYFVAVILW